MYSTTSRGNDGGAEIVFSELASMLCERGVEVVRTYRYPAPGATEPEFVLPLPRLRSRGYWSTLKQAPRRLASLLRLGYRLAKVRPDIINVHFVQVEAFYFLLLRPLLGFRLVLTFHGSDALNVGPSDCKLVSRLIRGADAVVAVSECVGEGVRGIAAPAQPDVTVIPNGVPLDFWMDEAARNTAPGQRLAAVGRLVRVKGHDVLIRAMELLRGAVPEATLVVIGDGEERSALEEEVSRRGVEDAITFVGRQTPEEVRSILRQADVFVMPSRSEGLPLALLEAMASGLPVVASHVGGIPEVLTREVGLLVPPEDPAALAQALTDVLQNPTRRVEMGHAARVRAQAFSSSRVTEAYEHLFLNLTARSPSSGGR